MTKEKQYKKELQALTSRLNNLLGYLDKEMEKKESPDRGKNLAKIANAMDYANDYAMHFGLEMTFKKIENVKKNRGRISLVPHHEEIESAVKEIGKKSTAPDKETPIWLEADIRAGMKWMYEKVTGLPLTTTERKQEKNDSSAI